MSDEPHGDLPQDQDPDDNPDLSDDAIERALEGFERELGDGSDDTEEHSGGNGIDNNAGNDGDNGEYEARNAGIAEHPAQHSVGDFDEELEGLLGNKAKVATIITQLTSAELLAAFCQVTDIAAVCVAGDQGAVAVLRNLEADAPERAARGLTTVVSGLVVVLAVNRADKLEATMYTHGEAGQTFVPPVLFASTASFVEDLMLGISTLDELRRGGLHMVDSADYDHRGAMQVIAEHTQYGRGDADEE